MSCEDKPGTGSNVQYVCQNPTRSCEKTFPHSSPDQPSSLMASMLHPAKGSVVEFLLEEGFAQYVDWSAQNAFSGPEKLRGSQKKAQDARKGRWRNFDPTKESVDHFEFVGKVVEVCSGDVFKIVNTGSPEREEKR